MALINWYRQGQKKELLQRILSHSLSATMRLYPRFGSSLFFEHPITNPFAHEERFLIELGDPELKVVSSYDEWMLFRTACSPCVGQLGPAPADAELFDFDKEGNLLISLLPHETLFIPFTFLSIKPLMPDTASSTVRALKRMSYEAESKSKAADERRDSKPQREVSKKSVDGAEVDETPSRTIILRIVSGTHGHVCSVLRIAVCPRPFVLNRVLRFFEPESSIMKRRIKLLEGNSNKGSRLGAMGKFATSSKFVHCIENESFDGDSRVMIEWGDKVSASEGLELLVRYRCGVFPEVGTFYLQIYDDPFQAQLYETWQVKQTSTIHPCSSLVALSSYSP